MESQEQATPDAPAANAHEATPYTLVAHSRPCLACFYDLLGTPVTAACPECGAPVETSVRAPVLRDASPEYLRAVKLGLILVINSLAAHFMVIPMLIALNVASEWSDNTAMFILGIVVLASVITSMYGYWLVGTTEPSRTLDERANDAPDTLRGTVVAQVAMCACAAIFFFAIHNELAIGVVIGWLLVFLFRIISVAAIVRRLALRVPDLTMFKRAQLCRWLLPLLFTVGWLALGIGPVIGLILYVMLLFRLLSHLTRIIKQQENSLAQLNAIGPTP